MKRNKSRPVNLELQTMHFPISAIASIAHRISGVIIFAGLGLLLWLLKISLFSFESFEVSKLILENYFVKLILWLFLTLFSYHVIGGIRHLIMDFGYFEELESGNKSAKVSFIITGILSLMMGIWIW